MLWVAAPLLAAEIEPLTGPSGAVAAMRARIVVVPTVPPVSGKVSVVL